MNLQLLGAYVLAAVVLVVVPGPNVVFIAGTAAARGRMAGLAAALGVEMATLTHGLVAALGLTAVIAASPVALTVVRLAGAAYLAWLGVRTLRGRDAAAVERAPRGRASLLDGFWVNLLNPKVVLFFLAFLPQFVDARAPWSAGTQVMVYALVIVAIGVVNSAGWVLGVTTLTGRSRGEGAAWLRRWLVGLLYLVLAAVAALGQISG